MITIDTMRRPGRFVDIQNFKQAFSENQEEVDADLEHEREEQFYKNDPNQRNDVMCVLEVANHEKKSMYGKGLTRKQHNPHRNADLLGVVSFYRQVKPEGEHQHQPMQIPRCIGSFYVPNPLHFSIGEHEMKQYLLEG